MRVFPCPLWVAVFLLAVGALSGRAAMGAFTEGYVQGAPAGEPLLLFGRSGHQTFLGCLTCNAYSADSVRNAYSRFGNLYNPQSIWNS